MWSPAASILVFDNCHKQCPEQPWQAAKGKINSQFEKEKNVCLKWEVQVTVL
jgi:hypothetical protein